MQSAQCWPQTNEMNGFGLFCARAFLEIPFANWQTVADEFKGVEEKKEIFVYIFVCMCACARTHVCA